MVTIYSQVQKERKYALRNTDISHNILSEECVIGKMSPKYDLNDLHLVKVGEDLLSQLSHWICGKSKSFHPKKSVTER